jgi:hypothetical protein
MFVCCVCCVLSGRGLCDELITHPEKSYRLWRVVVCDHETSWYEEAIARARLQCQRNNQRHNNNNNIYSRNPVTKAVHMCFKKPYCFFSCNISVKSRVNFSCLCTKAKFPVNIMVLYLTTVTIFNPETKLWSIWTYATVYWSVLKYCGPDCPLYAHLVLILISHLCHKELK